ncbi:MAG TPA: DMT family transporter [Micromonosporaceae bacterium]|nr:DMT family transporter [Micromonosporaceae bacterium]
MNDQSDRRAVLLAGGAALVTVVFWASAFVAIRQVGHDFGPGELALGRLTVGSVVLGIVVLARRGREPRRPRTRGDDVETSVTLAAAEPAPAVRVAMSRRETWFRLITIGVLWFGVYNVSLNAAERRVDAGTAAMLVNVGPILIAVLAGLVLREGFPGQLVVGLVVAFAGVVVIGLATSDGGASDVWGVVGCLVAAIVYAVSVVTQKPLLLAMSALRVTWIACTIGVIVCLPYAPGLIREIGRAQPANVWWIVYLGAFPTALAFTTWAYALARTSAGRLGVSTYVVPPIAILLGWWLLGEAPVAFAYLGGALCLLGVYVSRRPSRSVRRPRRLEPQPE